jgi:hypothetical protein
MSMGFRAESTNTSGVITVAGVDQVVINNAGDVAATTFTGALVGNAATATKLSTSTGTAPVYGIRAWVTFNSVVNSSGASDLSNTNRFIYGSGNVTNVFRNGTADYSVFFSTSMPSIYYAVHISAQGLNNNPIVIAPLSRTPAATAETQTASAFRFSTYNYNYTQYAESNYVSVIVVI